MMCRYALQWQEESLTIFLKKSSVMPVISTRQVSVLLLFQSQLLVQVHAAEAEVIVDHMIDESCLIV